MKEEGYSDNQLDAPFYLSTITSSQKKEIQDAITEAKKSNVLLYFVAALPFIGFTTAGVLIFLFLGDAPVFSLIFFVIFGVVASFAAYKAVIAKADKKIAKVSVPMVLKNIYGEDSSYNPYSGIDRPVVNESNIIRMGNRYSSDGLIKASYEGVNFVVSNILSQNETSSGKSTHTDTYFQGIFAIFPFNKKINSSVEIREDEAGFGTSLYFSSKDIIDMEDIEFNEQFNVYATDKEAAFYVITPQLIEVFKEIKKRIPGNLIFCIRGNQMIIAINNGFNKFQYSKSGKNMENYLKAVVDELLPYRWLIDVFKLKDKISVSSAASDKVEVSSKAEEDETESFLKKFE